MNASQSKNVNTAAIVGILVGTAMSPAISDEMGGQPLWLRMVVGVVVGGAAGRLAFCVSAIASRLGGQCASAKEAQRMSVRLT
jgi:hypothetical protein